MLKRTEEITNRIHLARDSLRRTPVESVCRLTCNSADECCLETIIRDRESACVLAKVETPNMGVGKRVMA
jgi:hypothetical protein